jgi:hypothetical protein
VSVKVTVRSNDRPHVRWLLAALLVPCAMAQTPEADERRREQWRQQEEQQRRAQEEMQRQQQKAAEEEKRQRDEASDRSRKETEEWLKKEAPRRQAQAAQSAKQAADAKALRQEMMRLPPLADDSNVLLGRWRLEGGGPNSANAARDQAILTGKGFGVGGANVGLGDLMGMLADPQPIRAVGLPAWQEALSPTAAATSKSSWRYPATAAQPPCPSKSQARIAWFGVAPVPWCASVRLRRKPQQMRRQRRATRARHQHRAARAPWSTAPPFAVPMAACCT